MPGTTLLTAVLLTSLGAQEPAPCAEVFYLGGAGQATAAGGREFYELRNHCGYEVMASVGFAWTGSGPAADREPLHRALRVQQNARRPLEVSDPNYAPQWLLVTRASTEATARPFASVPSCVRVDNLNPLSQDFPNYVIRNTCSTCREIAYRLVWWKPDDQIGQEPRPGRVKLAAGQTHYIGSEIKWWRVEIINAGDCSAGSGSGGGVIAPPKKPHPGPVPLPMPRIIPDPPPVAPRDLRFPTVAPIPVVEIDLAGRVEQSATAPSTVMNLPRQQVELRFAPGAEAYEVRLLDRELAIRATAPPSPRGSVILDLTVLEDGQYYLAVRSGNAPWRLVAVAIR